MDKIQALAEVIRDEKRSQTERDVAIAALRDLAINADSFHDRSTASHILKSIDGIPASESEPSDYMLRLLYLLDTTDTPENNAKARAMYKQQSKANGQ
jgi:hypothetical protein